MNWTLLTSQIPLFLFLCLSLSSPHPFSLSCSLSLSLFYLYQIMVLFVPLICQGPRAFGVVLPSASYPFLLFPKFCKFSQVPLPCAYFHPVFLTVLTFCCLFLCFLHQLKHPKSYRDQVSSFWYKKSLDKRLLSLFRVMKGSWSQPVYRDSEESHPAF